MRALGVENRPLDQFKQALEQLQTKLTAGGRLRKVGNALVWKFSKEEITGILARMERLETLVQVALQVDHLSVFIVPLQDKTANKSQQAMSSDQSVHGSSQRRPRIHYPHPNHRIRI